MSDSYTVFWKNDLCRWLRNAGDAGRPLRFLFGGPHQSAPSLSRFGVRPGDWVFPVRVEKGCLHVISRMQVREFMPFADYLTTVLGLSDADIETNLFALEDWLRAERPELGHLIPPYACIDEVAVAATGESLVFDRPFPGELLTSIRYRSSKAERGLKYVDGGKLTRSLGIEHGVYRLAPASASLFERLVLGSGRAA